MKTQVAVAVAALLAACGDPCSRDLTTPMRVEGAEGPAWTAPRTSAAASVAARAWGLESTNGLEVAFVSESLTCGGQQAGGCYDCGSIRVLVEGPCVEASALAHELGHAALGGDPGHTDPRWCDDEFWYGLMHELLDLTADGRCRFAIMWQMGWQERLHCPSAP